MATMVRQQMFGLAVGYEDQSLPRRRPEGRFFHDYHDCHCYLPLYVFCGQHLLAAKLGRANINEVPRVKPMG